MARVSKRSLARSAVASYSCVCVALLLLVVLTMWASYRDLQFVRSALLRAEIDRVRSHAQRTVGRIERDLEVRDAENLEDLDRDDWLLRHWQRVIPHEERRSYGAVVTPDGEVFLHSDPSRNGKRLARHWYTRVLSEVGDDVVETYSPDLAIGERAFDVRVPIEVNGREVGEYHAGFDISWFDSRIGESQDIFVRRRLLFIGGVLLIVLLASTSLFYIASHSISLRRAVDSASLERATEVGKLAGGLAHEIRNPLQAIRINLHALRNVHEQKAQLPDGEIAKALDQSTREIGRIEHLMQELVNFATPSEPRNDRVDLASEIRDVVEFIRQEMLRQNIELQTRLPSRAVWVNMDQGRLRQIMLNLLQNSQQAMEHGGHIDVGLTVRRGRVEMTVADDGPGIDEKHQTQIFEPFFTTRHDGSGLGLALIKRFIDEIEGEIRYETNRQGGATFHIVLKEASPPRLTQ